LPYVKPQHEIPPKEKILEEIGDITDIEVFNNNVLCAVYQRPTTITLGGKQFHLADKTVDEDRYQSKVGLILKIGQNAFKDPDGQWFDGVEFKEHDWIILPPSAATSMIVRGTLCRLVPDTQVKMRVPDPDDVY
jgi:hypothetical protein